MGTTLSVISCEFTLTFLFYSYTTLLHLHPFPTRRSSDLLVAPALAAWELYRRRATARQALALAAAPVELDRKSTRLNSSHLGISYAVFCLKKKRRDQARTVV